MQGKRYPDNFAAISMGPGGYARHTWTDPPHWQIKDPAGRIGSLGGKMSTHKVVEHEDGTITVDPSVLDARPGGWHGWLKSGVWG